MDPLTVNCSLIWCNSSKIIVSVKCYNVWKDRIGFLSTFDSYLGYKGATVLGDGKLYNLFTCTITYIKTVK